MKWLGERRGVHAWALGLAVLGTSGCTTTGRTVEVIALNGDEPQNLALVVSHRPDGSLLDTIQVDAAGRATPAVEDDSLVTVIYPYDGTSTRLYTIAVAGHAGELTIHGPAPLPSFDVVGRLDVTAPTNPSADGYQIRLACTGYDTNPYEGLFAPQTWPVSVEFSATCIGDDGRLPVIVLATANHAPIAYAAGMATLDNGVATFEVASWLPHAPNVPVQSNDASAQFEWTLWIDGLPFIGSMWPEGGLRWEGLPIERTTIHAWRTGTLSHQSTERNVLGVPTEIVFDDADFPAPIPPTLALTGAPTKAGIGHPLHFSWERSSVTADVLALYFGYLAYADQKTVMWSVALPPDATEFRTPAYEGPFATVGPRDDPDNALQRIDSPDVVGFDEVRNAGIYSLERNRSAMIVPPVSSGDLRVSSISWFGN